ncbi:MAG TPA: hypothetical protein VNX25_03870, partial [Verrucomicrobiae bacterium]|nr:hypothetical protein [Verrucomicrobiae bacterium]
MGRYSLKIKMAAAVGLMVTLLISIAAYVGVSSFRREFTDSISQQQFTLLKALADELDAKVEATRGELLDVATAAPAGVAADPRVARRFLTDHPDTRRVFDLGLIVISPAG